MDKKKSKNKGNKDLFRIISMFVMILLLPLLSALIFMGCEIIAHPTSIKMIQVCKIIIFGTPILLLLAYGYIMKEKITSILSGVFLIPLFFFYVDILYLYDKFDPYFWLRWMVLYEYSPFMLICGLAGYFASRGTKVSLLIAIFFGILFVYIMWGIGR
jgi:nitrous oxidase accessory protein